MSQDDNVKKLIYIFFLQKPFLNNLPVHKEITVVGTGCKQHGLERCGDFFIVEPFLISPAENNVSGNGPFPSQQYDSTKHYTVYFLWSY